MAEEFDLLKSLNIVVPAMATPSRCSSSAPSLDWDARSVSSVASSVVSLRIDRLSEAVVDRMVAHAREASPGHSLQMLSAPRKGQASSSYDGSICGASSVSVPASAAPSIASHWSNKCLVPPPTLKPSHSSSCAQSLSGNEAHESRRRGTIVLQPSTGALSQSHSFPRAAPSSVVSSSSASCAAQASRVPDNVSVSDGASFSSFQSAVAPSASTCDSALPRPLTAHGVSPLSIVVGFGERQPALYSGRKLQQQKYAQDLALQILSKTSDKSPAARKNDRTSTSLMFQPSETQQATSYPRERCPFQITKQEYKQQLLKQISDRVQAKQQQKQKDTIIFQNSLYCSAALQTQPSIVSTANSSFDQPSSHRLPLGVRSFLDPGNRSEKSIRQEYGAELKKQIMLQQSLKSQRDKA